MSSGGLPLLSALTKGAKELPLPAPSASLANLDHGSIEAIKIFYTVCGASLL